MTADEMEQHPDLPGVDRVIVGAVIVRPIPIEWVMMPCCYPPQMLEPFTRPVSPHAPSTTPTPAKDTPMTVSKLSPWVGLT